MWSALRRLICLLVLCGNLFAPLVAAPITQSEPTLTLVAVGDILLDRGVARQIERYGTGYPFSHVKNILTGADVTFGNLECPLSGKCDPAEKRYRFQAKPRYVQSLVKAGFDVLSLANNHSTDCGQVGLLETMSNLRTAGIRWCGAGVKLDEAASVTIMERNGIKVAFIGFSEFQSEYSGSKSNQAGIADNALRARRPRSQNSSSKPNQAGIAYASEESVRLSIGAARKQADVVIASFHWGAEYSSRPRFKEIKLAHIAVEAGADLVLGHHPHVLQGLQMVITKSGNTTRRSLIAYSLGNFVFDSPRGWDRRMNESIILRCTFSRNGLVAFESLPVVIDEYRPRPGNETEAKDILTRLDMLSAELNAN